MTRNISLGYMLAVEKPRDVSPVYPLTFTVDKRTLHPEPYKFFCRAFHTFRALNKPTLQEHLYNFIFTKNEIEKLRSRIEKLDLYVYMIDSGHDFGCFDDSATKLIYKVKWVG